MKKFIITFLCLVGFSWSACASVCVIDAGETESCTQDTQTVIDCEALGYTNADIADCKHYLLCPYNQSYKKCVSGISCEALGFTTVEFDDSCSKIVTCPGDENYKLCAVVCDYDTAPECYVDYPTWICEANAYGCYQRTRCREGYKLVGTECVEACTDGSYFYQDKCETEVPYALCSQNDEGCYVPSACKYGNGYMINGGPGSHVYSEALATIGHDKCYQVLGCKNEEALDTNIFTTRIQSFADVDCEAATGCQSGYVTSCPSYSTEYEKHSAYGTAGSIECLKCQCEYTTAAACQSDYPYATCTANSSTGCFEPTSCNASGGYANSYAPFFDYEEAGKIGNTTCYKIKGCSTRFKVSNTYYVNTSSVKLGNTTCDVFSGCRNDRQAYSSCPSGTTETTSLKVATLPSGDVYCKICQTSSGSSGDCDCGDACERFGDSSYDCQRQKECEASCNSGSTTTFTCDYRSYLAISKLDSSNPASGTNYDICGWKVATALTSNGVTTWSLTEQWIQYCCTSSGCNYSSTSNPPGISAISHYVDSHCGVIKSGNNYYVYLK